MRHRSLVSSAFAFSAAPRNLLSNHHHHQQQQQQHIYDSSRLSGRCMYYYPTKSTFQIVGSPSSRSNVRLRSTPEKVNDNDECVSKATSLDMDYIDTNQSDMLQETNLEILNENNQKTSLIQEDVGGKQVPLAVLLLNVVAILWGTQHAVIKMVVDDSSAAPFTLLRFALAALIALPYAPGLAVSNNVTLESSSETPMEDQVKLGWRWGAEMGAWMFLGFAFQAIGLETTTAQRSGFLLYLNVKFVPFFSRVILGRQISVSTWLSAFAAFLGTSLLATDGQSIGFNAGDIWSIAAAAASAMYIIRLEKATLEVEDTAQLNAASLIVVATMAAFWTFSDGLSGNLDVASTIDQLTTTAQTYPLQIFYLGAVATTLTNYIQAKGQKYVSPERASVFYSLDPVYGAFFSWYLLGEKIGGLQSIVGASIITLAAATNAFLDFGEQDKLSSSSSSSKKVS